MKLLKKVRVSFMLVGSSDDHAWVGLFLQPWHSVLAQVKSPEPSCLEKSLWKLAAFLGFSFLGCFLCTSLLGILQEHLMRGLSNWEADFGAANWKSKKTLNILGVLPRARAVRVRPMERLAKQEFFKIHDFIPSKLRFCWNLHKWLL